MLSGQLKGGRPRSHQTKKEEGYIAETNKDFHSDNENVAEVDFVVMKCIEEEEKVPIHHNQYHVWRVR